MSSNFSKWNSEKQNPDDPLYVVLFTSRNKDNRDVPEYHERRRAMLWHLPDTLSPSETLNRRFLSFVRDGSDGELSRIYITLNRRDPVKIKRMLMHQLIDDNLTGSTPLAHMETTVASIAAKKECAAEHKWFFDFDLADENTRDYFIKDVANAAGEDNSVSYVNTPHGYAVIVNHGFDIRKLSDFSKDLMQSGSITLKRDDMICVRWMRKEDTND